MSFGYVEWGYEVLSSHEEPTANGQRLVQLRQGRQGSLPYLAIEHRGRDGAIELDLLLLYRDSSELDVRTDFDRLVARPDQCINDLRWDERIEGHSHGTTKGGAIFLY